MPVYPVSEAQGETVSKKQTDTQEEFTQRHLHFWGPPHGLPLNLTGWLYWLASKLSLNTLPQHEGRRRMLPCLAFSMGTGGPNAGLHVCVAGTLPAEPSPP